MPRVKADLCAGTYSHIALFIDNRHDFLHFVRAVGVEEYEGLAASFTYYYRAEPIYKWAKKLHILIGGLEIYPPAAEVEYEHEFPYPIISFISIKKPRMHYDYITYQ